MKWWRWTWDIVFFLGSFLISFLLGVTLGNLIQGIPLDSHKEFAGTLESILHPYAILVGFLTVSLFLMHGSIYILMKTEGEFHDKMRRWTNPCIIFFILMYAVTTMATLIYMPHMIQAFHDRPIFFLVAIANLLFVAKHPSRDSSWPGCQSIYFIGFEYDLPVSLVCDRDIFHRHPGDQRS